jgi:hypothetical protein
VGALAKGFIMIRIVAALFAFALSACIPQNETELQQTPPTVVSTQEPIGPLFRRLSRLSRDCNDGSWVAGSFTTDTQYYDREGYGEITFRDVHLFGNVPHVKTLVSDEGLSRKVTIYGKGLEARRMAEWASGKNACR